MSMEEQKKYRRPKYVATAYEWNESKMFCRIFVSVGSWRELVFDVRMKPLEKWDVIYNNGSEDDFTEREVAMAKLCAIERMKEEQC